MKYLILFVIQAYWKLIPKHKRNKCLYSESCSKHVYRITEQKGWMLGLKAFISRYRTCRPGYRIYQKEGSNEYEMKLINGTTIDQDEISAYILEWYRTNKS